MATINDVAQLANVSGATVSHVINKTRKVNPETIEKVEWAIRELNYRPNAHARGLKTGQSRLIGLIHNYTGIDIFFTEIMESIENSAHTAGYDVISRHPEWVEQAQTDAINAFLENNVDGLIFDSPMLNDEFIKLMNQIDIPCLFLQLYDPALPGDSIHTDDQAAAYDAVRYLISLNHRRIACVAGFCFEQHSAYKRLAGYEKALQEAGLPVQDDYLILTNYYLQDGYDAFKKLISLPEPPTAIMTYSDLLAMGAIRAAADMGIAIPGDVSIIGFDDIQMTSFMVPRLTTVFQDKKRLGELAFEQIRKRIQNPQLPSEHIMLPAQLIIRDSCAPARLR